MILDKQLMFSEAQNLAQAAGNYLSTNTIDCGAAGSIAQGGSPVHDVGRGTPVQVEAVITETFTSGGAATLQVQIVMADDAALTSNLTVLQETPALALATLVAGYRFALAAIPPGISKRYLGLRFVIGAAATTAGKVTAGLVLDKQTSYA